MTVINVAFVVYEQMLVTSLTLPIEMLKAGEAFAKRHSDRKTFRTLDIQLISENGRTIQSIIGAPIPTTPITDAKQQQDFIITPSIWRNPRPVLRNSTLSIDWLNKQWGGGATLIGVGTGVCLIAETTLLDSHPATTHWHYASQFKRDYPNVDLKPDYFITQSERMYTVASLNALADVIVHLISQIYGTSAAQHVQRNFSHEVRKPYEEQRFLEGGSDRHPDELIADIQFWIKSNMHEEISFHEVATQFGISYRTMTRRFNQAIALSPLEYLQKIRIEAATDLLAGSNLEIQEVAIAVGFSSQGQLTRLFKAYLGQTPSEYRKVVRKKLFSQ
ncbi:GlxA family transcriptional regulator [Pseudoalteromonas xiamenensis]|uniref:GlxA family transcriptional regulator n=1 Tax=Pseudoalteromonas xiamenensis TaxID=882626 RepID=UPI0035EAAAF6